MNIEYIIKLSDTAVSLLKHVYASILGQIHNSSPRPIVGEPLSIDPITNDEEREALNELIRIGYLKCGALGTTHNLMVTQRGEDYLMALNAVPFRPI